MPLSYVLTTVRAKSVKEVLIVVMLAIAGNFSINSSGNAGRPDIWRRPVKNHWKFIIPDVDPLRSNYWKLSLHHP